MVLAAGVLLSMVLSDDLDAALINLYDGTGLPANQAWLAYANDGILTGGTAAQNSVVGGVQLSTDLPVSAGYSNYTPFSNFKNPTFPTLDRSVGFELAFSLTIGSENHISNDRAGFSAILLGSDKRGIELGFWSNEIWAQSSSPLFLHAEGVAVNTLVSRNYRLQILNNTYSLFDASNLLLTGAVRDYTAFMETPGGIPYTLSNYLFLGDNTSSGAAVVSLGPISLQSNLSTVPEPNSLLLLTGGLLITRFPRRR